MWEHFSICFMLSLNCFFWPPGWRRPESSSPHRIRRGRRLDCMRIACTIQPSCRCIIHVFHNSSNPMNARVSLSYHTHKSLLLMNFIANPYTAYASYLDVEVDWSRLTGFEMRIFLRPSLMHSSLPSWLVSACRIAVYISSNGKLFWAPKTKTKINSIILYTFSKKNTPK